MHRGIKVYKCDRIDLLTTFANKKEEFYDKANKYIIDALNKYYREENYSNTNPRRLAATFRQEDLIEFKYLS